MTDFTSFDIAHLGSVELLTPEFEKSLWFFRDLLAMRVVADAGDSIYLRTWDEYQLYTMKLTRSGSTAAYMVREPRTEARGPMRTYLISTVVIVGCGGAPKPQPQPPVVDSTVKVRATPVWLRMDDGGRPAWAPGRG